MVAVIETEGLTKFYGRSRGIWFVDLEVNEGEVFGFLGPNGAGKTTTIRTLLNFLRPTLGRAWIFGMDTRRESVAIRERVGNLPGEFALEDRMTGEKLLRFFAQLRGVGNLSYAYELAERLGADLHRPMRRLSRGNKQKIGLIQAMFHKPLLLILDEPTGGVDPLVHEELLKIIVETKAEGRTVFFSSHVLTEIDRIRDRVGIIRDGRLAAVETTEALVNKAFRHVRLSFAEPGGGLLDLLYRRRGRRPDVSAGEARVSRLGSEPRGKTWHRAHGTLASLVAPVLRLQFRSVVIWGVALGLLSVLTVASFPSIGQDPQLNEVLQNYPPEMRELFGSREGTDFSTIEGFLGSRLFNFLIPLALAFFPILASAGAIARAEERGTIDVLLSNPIPRWQLVVGNFVATALSPLGILAIFDLYTWIPALLLDVDLPVRTAAEAVLNPWPLCMFFGGLAMLGSALFRRRVLAIAIPGAVLVAMYFVNGLGNVVEKLEGVRHFTVFYYYGLAMENGIEWASFDGVALCALLLVLLAALLFGQRDIYT